MKGGSWQFDLCNGMERMGTENHVCGGHCIAAVRGWFGLVS